MVQSFTARGSPPDKQAEDQNVGDQKRWHERSHEVEPSSKHSRVKPNLPALIEDEQQVSGAPEVKKHTLLLAHDVRFTDATVATIARMPAMRSP